MTRFIGREDELRQLGGELSKNSSATLVYGKRRVGKTTLIKKALEQYGQGKGIVYYECVRGTLRDNLDAFTRVLETNHILPFSTTFPGFRDAFAFLATLPRKFIVVIDEYPYLKSMAPAPLVDSTFQNIIDNNLPNISLVLSGSQIGVMREMLAEGNALYGRFGRVIRLRELSYRDAAAFYPSLAPYDRIAVHSVFGGSPFVLEQIRGFASLPDAIRGAILDENNPVNLYASHILLSDYSNSMNAERIFTALGNGRKKYSELESQLNARRNGGLAKQLKSLTDVDAIRRTTPINRPGDAKKGGYEINDNLLRFYFTFVHRNLSALQMLGEAAFYDQYVAPALTGFISHRFEEICRDFFAIQARAGRLPGVRNIGTYYYDDPATRTNGEFDVALDNGGSYTLFEAKYYRNPMTLDEIHREAGQVRAIRGLDVAGLGFIAANGFERKEDGYTYYTADDLYA